MNFGRLLNFTISILSLWIQKSVQHGYLADPPQRSSVWRENADAPINYNDNQLFCGGRENLRLNGGRCGTCGDPFQGPHDNEAGGKYARGIIVRSYPDNQRRLPVKVVLTAYHKGFYEFKICPHNSPGTPVSKRCLDRHPLQIVEAGVRDKTRYYPKGSGVHQLTLILPRGLSCSQCVLQWRYKTGNSWGVDNARRRGCMGCGHQEEFWNCADIRIGSNTRNQHYVDSDEVNGHFDLNHNPFIKETGIKILNHFFSPFISSGLHNVFGNNANHLSVTPERGGFTVSVSNNNNAVLHTRHHTERVQQHTFKNQKSDESSEEKNNFNNVNSRILQNVGTRSPTGSSKLEIQQQQQQPRKQAETFHWGSLITGNHGQIQTSFLPQEDWNLLEFFDK